MARPKPDGAGVAELEQLDDIQDHRRTLMESFKDLLLMPDVIERAYEDGALFARLIRTAVLEYGVKQTVLAARIRHSSASISRWMNGQSLPPQFTREGVLRTIAKLIDEGLARQAASEEAFGTII